MSFLKKNILKNSWIDKNKIKLDIKNNNKKYKFKIIKNSVIYIKKFAKSYLSKFYYLIS